jgi:hypothetical protein
MFQKKARQFARSYLEKKFRRSGGKLAVAPPRLSAAG